MADVAGLKDFSGQIVQPNDAEYSLAAKNYVRQGAPALVLRPKTAQDVALAISYARDNSLALAVKSGGHSVAGYSTNDDGLVIDVSLLCSVEILDADKRIVRVGSGAVWGDVCDALKPHGLAITSGDTKSVGVGGLTLGGGLGWMMRKYGLTIDNIAAAEIVMADGQILQLSETENADVFWAIRGGSGNFGIVTHFDFVARPVSNVVAGMIVYGTDEIANVITGWRDHMRTAPAELTSFLLLMPGFAGIMPAGVMITNCYASDDIAAANAAIDPLKNLGTVLSDDTKLMAYADILEEAHPPEGMRAVVKNNFFKTLNNELIEVLAEQCCIPGKSPIVQLRFTGGVENEAASDSTAFAHRGNELFAFSGTILPVDADATVEAEALKPWQAIAAFGSGAYANFLSTDTPEDIADIWPQKTYEKLVTIKTKYDPSNIFNSTYNIKPEAK